MNSVVDRVEALEAELAGVLADVFEGEQIPDLPDAELMRLLDVAARLQRRVDGVLVEAAVQVRDRSEGLRDERLTTRHGCQRPVDLLSMVCRIDKAHAGRLVRAAGYAARARGITDGVFLPAKYDRLRDALLVGDVGLGGLLAGADPVEHARARISDEQRAAADRLVAAYATGVVLHPDTGVEIGRVPVPSPGEVAEFSRAVVAVLDPDGAEPDDEIASRNRGLRFGALRDGVYPVSGGLLPEVYAQWQRLNDALLSPRAGAGVCFDDAADPETNPNGGIDQGDDRTRAQRLHDALATILTVAARGGELPDLGGASPTLVVTVTAADYAAGTGFAHVDGADDGPVPIRVAAQTGCAGGIQRVLFDDRGRIASLGTSGRVFNALQRRAIVARDGGCVVPGCTIPATWCEIHHVQEHAQGGPTHTDNGVLLCWHHHRTLHLSHWQIRMRHGVPEIRGPAWWDSRRDWHPTGKARVRTLASRASP
ncbi:HNH endonuclease [Microbacterium bovistercoris]|uniref:HNH endonuclease n=1 Tax=Microbacterium bovistercoris TaxID=2293570 RepID=A0A371NUQ0_9MICO|nr:HNH endonuclease signature motif containing protein [Microbacterium bovistercoris]REJ06101.1 HNH endonuclease [Microbacterium bovistercoris]